ncbi:hypothetical protein HDV05_003012 [Chytridiales sp. JEL 0842]|nr:hypothetical protein HDV05_003012 [Chytridiales sp. JEL 0842]
MYSDQLPQQPQQPSTKNQLKGHRRYNPKPKGRSQDAGGEAMVPAASPNTTSSAAPKVASANKATPHDTVEKTMTSSTSTESLVSTDGTHRQPRKPRPRKSKVDLKPLNDGVDGAAQKQDCTKTPVHTPVTPSAASKCVLEIESADIKEASKISTPKMMTNVESAYKVSKAQLVEKEQNQEPNAEKKVAVPEAKHDESSTSPSTVRKPRTRSVPKENAVNKKATASPALRTVSTQVSGTLDPTAPVSAAVVTEELSCASYVLANQHGNEAEAKAKTKEGYAAQKNAKLKQRLIRLIETRKQSSPTKSGTSEPTRKPSTAPDKHVSSTVVTPCPAVAMLALKTLGKPKSQFNTDEPSLESQLHDAHKRIQSLEKELENMKGIRAREAQISAIQGQIIVDLQRKFERILMISEQAGGVMTGMCGFEGVVEKNKQESVGLGEGGKRGLAGVLSSSAGVVHRTKLLKPTKSKAFVSSATPATVAPSAAAITTDATNSGNPADSVPPHASSETPATHEEEKRGVTKRAPRQPKHKQDNGVMAAKAGEGKAAEEDDADVGVSEIDSDFTGGVSKRGRWSGGARSRGGRGGRYRGMYGGRYRGMRGGRGRWMGNRRVEGVVGEVVNEA